MSETLQQIIKRKANEADLNRGKLSTQIELPGGLRIAIRRDIGKYTVYLQREGLTQPSETEIETFLKSWDPRNGNLMPKNPRVTLVFEIDEWRNPA